MNTEYIGLITTLLLGIFILIGASFAFVVKRKEKIVDLSIGLAFGVIVMLIATDLLPEIIEQLEIKHIYLFLIFTIIGFMLLKVLDNFIPDHDETKMTKKEAKENLIHIGIITSFALALHNIIEGMAVYSTIITDQTLGFTLMIGVGFHNIPLGMVIASSFYQSNGSKEKTLLSILGVSLSTFLGGIIMYLFKIQTISPILLGILLSITLGMLLFISLHELLPRIKNTKNKKTTMIGIGIGVIILLISLFF